MSGVIKDLAEYLKDESSTLQLMKEPVIEITDGNIIIAFYFYFYHLINYYYSSSRTRKVYAVVKVIGGTSFTIHICKW
jgi:hypothetical protein